MPLIRGSHSGHEQIAEHYGDRARRGSARAARSTLVLCNSLNCRYWAMWVHDINGRATTSTQSRCDGAEFGTH